MKMSKLLALLASASITAAASVALAALPPRALALARKEAPLHVQIKLQSLRKSKKSPLMCVAKGRIVKVFRDAKKQLKAGKTIVTFPVGCASKGQEIPIGGFYFNYGALKKAKYLEGFFHRDKKTLRLARGQLRIIAKPTSKPANWNDR